MKKTPKSTAKVPPIVPLATLQDPVIPISPEQQYCEEIAQNEQQLMDLLPAESISLSLSEQAEIQRYLEATLVLGGAANVAMLCSTECPIKQTCPLVALNRAPVGKRCSIEIEFLKHRFISYLKELNLTLNTLPASIRSYLTSLVTIEVYERRCTEILSYAKNAQLQSRSVRDVDTETGEPIAWEDIIAINEQERQTLIDKKRMLLDDLELTPKAITRKQKMLNSFKSQQKGRDASTDWSNQFDKIRSVTGGSTIRVDPA